ncbi:secologanin synthase-like [Andrographis paniculata]|uniref:secologanin synthase-like n=1 Tax=Andrographis paniculata TaxID=175694 RepID=UPI0021E92DDC|nr:secologanin synthase-like [Andrographis paniculata]
MWQFVAISILTVFLVWLWKVFDIFWLEPRRIEKILRKQGFNGNPYRPPFGDTTEIQEMYADVLSRPLGLHEDIIPRVMPHVQKTINQYGKNSFTWMGPRPRIYVTDPQSMREIMLRHVVFNKNFKVSNKMIKLLVRGGLIEFEEEKWAMHRAKMNPGFHMDKLKNMCPIFVAHAETAFDKWRSKLSNGSGVVDVFKDMKIFTASSISKALYSRPFDKDMQTCFFSLLELSHMANKNISVKSLDLPGKELLPTPMVKKGEKMETELFSIFRTMIVERLKKRRAGLKDKQDLIDIFIDDLYDEKRAKELDEEGIINDAAGNCKVFSFAGFETSANLLVWSMISLAIYPEWQTRAREEVQTVLSGRSKLESDDLSKLKLVGMILNEVLRFYPPVFELSRVVGEDAQIGKYVFPKGVLLQLPLIFLHRDKNIWGPDADIFNPMRFSEGVMKAANGQAAFMPFGWGPRICLGMNFLLIEAKVFLAQALNAFTWDLSPEYIHAPLAAFSLMPQHGAPLMLREI